MKKILLVILILVGCDRFTSHTVVWEDGKQAFVVTDSVDKRCYSQAAELCPQGYNVLQKREEDYGAVSCTLYFRCK